jgi:hypothetical protein
MTFNPAKTRCGRGRLPKVFDHHAVHEIIARSIATTLLQLTATDHA